VSHCVGENFRSNGAAEMVLALAPIDTGATERALLAFERINFDTAPGQELASLVSGWGDAGLAREFGC
jgi:hypothetical protein